MPVGIGRNSDFCFLVHDNHAGKGIAVLVENGSPNLPRVLCREREWQKSHCQQQQKAAEGILCPYIRYSRHIEFTLLNFKDEKKSLKIQPFISWNGFCVEAL
jgi:hypothetical protein